MLGGEDTDGFLISLLGGVTNFLQLSTKLISGEWCPITVVHIQDKELIRAKRRKHLSHLGSFGPSVTRMKMSLFSALVCQKLSSYHPSHPFVHVNHNSSMLRLAMVFHKVLSLARLANRTICCVPK